MLLCPLRAARYDCVLDTGASLPRAQVETAGRDPVRVERRGRTAPPGTTPDELAQLHFETAPTFLERADDKDA